MAVVIVSFNERTVIADTVAACEQLTFANRTVIVGDDSDDPETVDLLRRLARARGCRRVDRTDGDGEAELWESERFVLFHRRHNAGFKAGNLKAMEGYLRLRGFDYLYLLDADWRPQPDALERCLETIAAAPDAAFVQTKRLYHYGRRDHFQRCLAINEEACYLADLPGRQRLGQMILFSGCCTLFDLPALQAVGGFRAGHLTEDIDLSNRFYLAGYRGIYLEDVANVGEVPPNYRAFRRQQERWASGSARTCREFLRPVLASGLDPATKSSLLRQNAYFAVALVVEAAIVWNVAAFGISWLAARAGTATFRPGRLAWVLTAATPPVLLATLASSALPLVVTVVKKREWINLLYLPMATWLAYSVLHTYALASIGGWRNTRQTWVVTPKTNRRQVTVAVRSARWMRLLNLATLALLLLTYLGSLHGSGDRSEQVLITAFALLWIPSLTIATLKS